MEIIIRISITLVMLFTGIAINAQSTPTCGGTNASLPCSYTPDWQWWNATNSNWAGQIGSVTTTMTCPFYGGTNTDDMLSIDNGLDYLPAQGWKLLAKDFGCPGGQAVTNGMPYFILYNKYKSIIRVFLYFGLQSSGTKASLVLRWNTSANNATDNNSLFTLSNKYAKANETYSLTGGSSEKQVNYINSLPVNGWSVTEYLVNFDPHTVKSVGNFQFINFDYHLQSISNIDLNGNFSFTTESATAKNVGAPTQNTSNPNLLDYVVTGESYLGKVPKKSELENGFNQLTAKTNSINEKFCNKFTLGLVNANTSLQSGKLKDFLLGAASFAEGLDGGLGTIASVLELFMTKSNSAAAGSTQSYVQPTVSKGDITLTGTIVTESSPLNISVQLPGTSHKYADGKFNCPNLQIYDCPMGVVSLQEAPTIGVRSWTEPDRTGNYTCSIDFDIPTGFCTPLPSTPSGITLITLTATPTHTTFRSANSSPCGVTGNNRVLKSYKVTGDIKLALNGAAGVQIEASKAALFFVIKNNGGTPALDIFTNGPAIPVSCCNGTVQLPNTCSFLPATGPNQNFPTFFNNTSVYQDVIPYKNHIKDLLNDNILKLSSLDSLGFHSFQTPFIDIDKFKNTAITVEDGVDVYLKLLVSMRPTDLADDQTPIVNVVTYEIPAGMFVSDPGTTPYNMTCAQKIEMDSVKIGQTNLSSTMSDTYVAGYNIQTAPSSTNNILPTIQAELEAYSCISLKPTFRAQISPASASFRAYLNPNAGGCETSDNALVVSTYTFNCSDDASTSRLAHLNNTDEAQSKTALSNDNSSLKMTVAPNPNNGNFNLIFNRPVTSGVVKIINSMGQEVYKKELEDNSSIYELNMVGILTNGIYYISWNNAKFVINRKLIVE